MPKKLFVIFALMISPCSVFAQSIHMLCKSNRAEELQRQIAAHPESLNEEDMFGNTPIHVASFEGHVVSVQVLLTAGAKVDGDANRGKTPLHLAAMNGHTLVCKALVEHDAPVNALDVDKQTPMHLVAEGGFEGICYLLRYHGADLSLNDSWRGTALDVATQYGQQAVVTCLQKEAVTSDDLKRFGLDSPLVVAPSAVEAIDVMQLVESLPARGKEDGQTYYCKHFQDLEGLSDYASPYGDDMAEQPEFMNPRQHMICVAGDVDGALTAYPSIHVATMLGKTDHVVRYLDRGQKIDANDYMRRSALHFAAQLGDVPTAELLLQRGARPDAQTSYGKTPAHYAAENGQNAILVLLKHFGANLMMPDNQNQEPMVTARLHENDGTGKLLRALTNQQSQKINWLEVFARLLNRK